MTVRTNTPDRLNDNGSTTITLKRACNGCSQHLGDVDSRDVDEHGNLTDVRAECEHCRPLVALEAAGCKTWQLTERSISRVDDEVDRLGVFAKAFTEMVDGKVTTVGLRVGEKPGHVVARFGDWLVMDLEGRFTVHSAPAAKESVAAVATSGQAAEQLPAVMPHNHAEYVHIRDTNPRPGPCCATAGPVQHWPMWGHCGGGNGPGKPIRPHCTCDSCF